MPHSSGGGSHGGGSHGGHHSSSRSGSGSRISRNYFVGARTYVRYRNHTPEYLYTNSDIQKKRSKARYLLIVFYLPFIIATIILAYTTFTPPKKIADNCSHPTLIVDDIGIMNSKDSITLKSTLNSFYEKTGISVCIMTVYDSAWKNKYNNLEKYAYAEYVKRYVKDENHWLFVYSEPESHPADFIAWSWEGMQGDNTDGILSPYLLDKFNTNLQDYLLAENNYNVCQAFNQAFNDLIPEVMEMHIDVGMVLTLVLLTAFISFHMYFMVFYDSSKKYKDYTFVGTEATVKEATCDYCRGIYVVGTCISCPHCGAPLSHQS